MLNLSSRLRLTKRKCVFGFLGLLRSCVFSGAHDRNRRWMQARRAAALPPPLSSCFQYDLITLYLWTRHGRNQGFPNPVYLIERIDDENKQERKNKIYQIQQNGYGFYFLFFVFIFYFVVAWRGNVEIQLLARLFTTLQFYLFSFFFSSRF